jgi:hypothetical protein
MKHTQESLDALPRKGDVVEVAEELGISTDGTRAEITARIIAEQPAEDQPDPEAKPPCGESPCSEEGCDADGCPVDKSDETESGADSSEPETEPVFEADEPAPTVKIDGRTANALEVIIGTYVGAEKAKSSKKEYVALLETGRQLCVVKGEGNEKFAVKLFDEEFNPLDCSEDISPRTRGVVVNVSRFLVNKRLYPRG